MTTELQTVSPVVATVETAPMVWSAKGKGGDVLVKQAFCATSQAFAPKAARLADGQAKDLAQLMSGTYRPVLRSIDAKMTDKEKVYLWGKNVSVSREKPTKDEMVPFADAVIGLWAAKKGERAAMAAMLRQYVDAVTASTKS